MGLLHSDEPVTDASVSCPQCHGLDWIVRTPRFGGVEAIVCRACGHQEGPTLSEQDMVDTRQDEAERTEAGRSALAAATFAVYVPAGLMWRPEAFSFLEEKEPSSVRVVCEQPSLSVVSELAGAGERTAAEELRGVLAETMYADPPRAGRSDAAYALEVYRREQRLDREVGELAVRRGTLRLGGRDVPCETLRTGAAWAAYAGLGDVVVMAGSAEVPMELVELVRHA